MLCASVVQLLSRHLAQMKCSRVALQVFPQICSTLQSAFDSWEKEKGFAPFLRFPTCCSTLKDYAMEWPIMNEIFTEEESDNSDGNNEVIKPM
ncbi:Leucine-Rich Repeat Transmembrane Neuronal Protein 3 [Manis pentadactyla]|nr:Leucine-Rich Repeat Transmembrane Neuronal Protein 3 [Manis pentadactyla]